MHAVILVLLLSGVAWGACERPWLARWEIQLGTRTVRCCARHVAGGAPFSVDGYTLRRSCAIRGGFGIRSVDEEGAPGPVFVEYGRLGRRCSLVGAMVEGEFLGAGIFQTDALTGTCGRRTFELRRMQ
jgi:hypothetical protein